VSKRALIVTVGVVAVLAVVGLSTVEVSSPPDDEGAPEGAAPGDASSQDSPARRGRIDVTKIGEAIDRIKNKTELRETIAEEREQVEIRRRAVERITAQIEEQEEASEDSPRARSQNLQARKEMAERALEMHTRRLARLEELLDDPNAMAKLED